MCGREVRKEFSESWRTRAAGKWAGVECFDLVVVLGLAAFFRTSIDPFTAFVRLVFLGPGRAISAGRAAAAISTRLSAGIRGSRDELAA